MSIIEIRKDDVADEFLYAFWRCMSDDYKERYKRNIWEQFENGVRSAAYTSRLTEFLTKIKKMLPIELQLQYMKAINKIVNSGCDKQVLNWIRNETAYLVMRVRIRNEERNDAYKERTKKRKEGEIEGIRDANVDDLINENINTDEL